MLKRAIARPGVREIMAIYRNWQAADRGLNTHRAATKEAYLISTTDRANSP